MTYIYKYICRIDNTQIIIPTLRLLGAFVSGNAKLTQEVVDSCVLDILPKLLGHTNKRIKKEVCWMISNIAAGTLIQVETLVAKGYLPILTKVLKDEDEEIKKEAVWAICNFTLVEKRDLIKSNFDNRILETVCEILKFKEPKYIAVAIESLGNLLNCGKLYPNQDGSNPIVWKVEELGMFDLLEQLQYHPVQIVYEKTIGLLEKYFELDQ
jgi:importin subunit alpha-6/7